MKARGRGAGGFVAAALFITACALLPLLFVPRISRDAAPESPDSAAPASARAELFASYWRGETERRRLELTQDDGENVAACRILASEILATLGVDAEAPEPDGAQVSYFTLESGGESVRLMEFSQGWTGDWRNWFSVHLDLDTHEVYRAYLSSQCLDNFEAYPLAFPSAQDTAEEWFRLLGCEGGEAVTDAEDPLPVETTEFSQSMETEFGIYYRHEDRSELRYDVYVKCYADDYPSMIRDLMFTMPGGAESET